MLGGSTALAQNCPSDVSVTAVTSEQIFGGTVETTVTVSWQSQGNNQKWLSIQKQGEWPDLVNVNATATGIYVYKFFHDPTLPVYVTITTTSGGQNGNHAVCYQNSLFFGL